MSQGNAREISLGDDFGEVIVRANGIRVELHVDGSVDAYTREAVHAHPSTNDDDTLSPSAKVEPKPGDKMADGTIYAGSLDGRDLYTTPEDAKLTYTFNGAAKYAQQLNSEKFLDHKDWRVPTKAELNVMWMNRKAGALKGSFNETDSEPAGWYWSSTVSETSNGACSQHFSNGLQIYDDKYDDGSLRCVRG